MNHGDRAALWKRLSGAIMRTTTADNPSGTRGRGDLYAHVLHVSIPGKRSTADVTDVYEAAQSC